MAHRHAGNPVLRIPPRLPGSEAPEIHISTQRTAAEIERIYPDLPPPPVEPKVQPGPGGKPYTLADLQRLAAANSPTLRQAASDVEAAKGNLIQAKTYPNPTIAYMQTPSNNNNTGQETGGSIDQPIIMGGKQKLGSAASQKDLDNAILALKRCAQRPVHRRAHRLLRGARRCRDIGGEPGAGAVQRRDLSTPDRVAPRAQAAPYEPTALRAQAFTVRLAYKQAIASYLYDWKTLVATLGLPQLPLSEIAGQVDRFIPYYDYDEVLRLRLAQSHRHPDGPQRPQEGPVQPQADSGHASFPRPRRDLDDAERLRKPAVRNVPARHHRLPSAHLGPEQGEHHRHPGRLVRASEESHRVEVTLTNGLALAYEGYRNNLYAMEYYRRNVLPDLVRYYRGVFARRQIDPSSAFGDLVAAQQMLSSNVTAYLGILSSLWSSAVSVADFLQTDDLFQVAKQRELPQLPDFNELSHWACGHDSVAASCARAPMLVAVPPRRPAQARPQPGPLVVCRVGPPGSRQSRRLLRPEPAEGCQASPKGIMKSKLSKEEDHESRISSLGVMVRQAGGSGRPASRTKEMVARKRRNEDSVMARTARIFPMVMFLEGYCCCPRPAGKPRLRRLHPRLRRLHPQLRRCPGASRGNPARVQRTCERASSSPAPLRGAGPGGVGARIPQDAPPAPRPASLVVPAGSWTWASAARPGAVLRARPAARPAAVAAAARLVHRLSFRHHPPAPLLRYGEIRAW